MKRCLFSLREVLLTSSSYSTVRTCIVSLVFVLLAINCGPPPQSQYHVPETAAKAAEGATTAQATAGQASLPGSATVRLQEMPYLRNAFKEPPSTGSRTALNDFYATTRAQVRHAAIISDGSLDVLKAFIANGWAPIVMIRFQGRNPEILPVSQYNDQLSEVFLQNPTSLSERRISYADFEKSWAADSRNQCLLITPQQLTQVDIERVLGKYLPQGTFQQVSIRSR
ncbi:MAG: hypothetical protein OXU36_07290 [Candidatus Poribacteria bacterium]|nr:hypothetical protein [Candidatus Poribacteria bacterium]